MSSTNTTAKETTEPADTSEMIAYYALIVVVVGTPLNILTFIILCRSTFRNANARPILHYMRAMAIFDILMLYGWNIDHYFSIMHGFQIQTSSIPVCRFCSFLNYFAPQSSAWLRVFVCWDRYLSLSRLHKTWFSHPKNVLTIIACIMIILFLLNCQMFFLACYYIAPGKITVFSLAFEIYPVWDYVNLGVYNCAPFILMVTFNSGVIYHLIQLRCTSTIRNSRIQHRSISIALVITTFMFLMMTIPATVGFAFFSTSYRPVLQFLDGLLYSYHILSFPLYIITFDEFRHNFINMIKCDKNNRRVGQEGITLAAPQQWNAARMNITT
ncbi:unnamed protein product [Rotaria magnacalcarata]|uniref:G-protein coupled receptors family 1 profile domain-containing protein n=1 Tax=Rotaria magnacalcarata TaxID=392030 RepID=A0A820GM67_9BILA|nr:unnamed protein product [Rotaria magnacalcarata]CAF4280198.1 unnamed protein product [Rotaria magnacalcarata]